MMQKMHFLAIFIALFALGQTSEITLNDGIGQCLSDLVTKELSVSYNYLQLSSKFGTAKAYPGFSSLFVKLSDEDTSKAHGLTKFLALRKASLTRLIQKDGVKVLSEIPNVLHIYQAVVEARRQNTLAWNEAVRCHQEADNRKDANVQDYLESHLLEHHLEVDKLLSDIERRIDSVQESDKKLTTFMIDEELLTTFGDRRKKVF